MKIRKLKPVEALTPIEVSRRTDVPMAWLLRMLDRGKIKHTKSSWLRLIASTELDKIRLLYHEG